ncbi:hypothetical protein J4229_00095 [Candidatus Pacearchaeota archaeon]|nr:hypothetical protein [Candidatus Pacearchaeota archaeon]
MTKTKKAIRGNFDFVVQSIVPSLIQGEDAKALYNKVSKTIKSGVWYDKKSKTIKGSSTFLAARVDSIVRDLNKGIRVATLADLNKPEIMSMIKDNHYSDTPAIVFRSTEDSFNPNKALIADLIPQVEQKMGKLQLPVLITGFDVVPSEDKTGYRLDIIPRKDFAVLQDNRLSGKYDGKRFSTVDKDGLPNFDIKGNRTWYARNEGLSRLYWGGDLGLDSGFGGGSLADSSEDGRVVVVREAPAQKK